MTSTAIKFACWKYVQPSDMYFLNYSPNQSTLNIMNILKSNMVVMFINFIYVKKDISAEIIYYAPAFRGLID